MPPTSERLLADSWPAHWIACPGVPRGEYGVFLFRKSFALATRPEHFVIHASADARYRFWINGHLLAVGPQRGYPAGWHYDSFDLAPWLTAGTNLLTARVISYGEYEPYSVMTQRTGLLVQGDTEAEDVVNSNESWKVVRDEGDSPVPIDQAHVPGYFAIGPGDRLDAALHPWGWKSANFDDHAWKPALALDRGIPWGHGTDIGTWLIPRNIPLPEETPQRLKSVRRSSGVTPREGFLDGKAPFAVGAHSHAVVLLDQGFETSAYPQLKVDGGRGSRIRISYAEGLMDAKGDKGDRDAIEGRELRGIADEFLPDGGDDRHFAPVDFRTFRYVQLDIETADAPLVVKDFSGVFTGYPFQREATFSSNDPQLERVWDVGWRTARLCAYETYVDCPYYEQLQYVGDTRIQALISLNVAGDDRLVRNAIDLLDHSRIADGLTQSRYPSVMPQIINTFSLFWIEMVRDYWMHRSDDAFVRARLPGVESVLGWFERKIDPSTGLLGPLDYWSFVDWTKEWNWDGARGIGGEPAGAREGGSAIISLQLAGTLDHAAELCRAFGRADQAEHYEKLAASLKSAVMKQCWDEKKRLVADTPARQVFSQHANAFAVLCGAVKGDEARDLMQRVARDPSLVQASTYFRFYLLRAMKSAGLGDEYLEMLGPWKTMLDRGLTTFAEQPDPTRSDCHAWSASPIYEFMATVCGIEPAAPGFAVVRIEPHLGRLTQAHASLPHPNGPIEVQLNRDGDALQATVVLPANLTGTIVWHGKSVALRPGTQTLRMP
ncbi:MAG TPA: family 78 glycoside hydrolase catalytic domain [Candidatus Didemnitutus sp.]|nr:family 78 glycoside hydrolase catalytic domain [Candidatus Didemnitutus sp.]